MALFNIIRSLLPGHTPTNARGPQTQPRRVSNKPQPARYGRKHAPQMSGVRHKVACVIFNQAASVAWKFADARAPWVVQRAMTLPNRIHPKYGLTNFSAALQLSVSMFARRSPRAQREIYFVTDGAHNEGIEHFERSLDQVAKAGIRVNPVPIDANLEPLKRMAKVTGGRIYAPSDIKEFVDVLSKAPRTRLIHGGQSDLMFAVDVSHSMTGQWGSQRKIDAVRDAIIRLLEWHQKTYRA